MASQRDLFGKPIRQRKSRNQTLLESYDRSTMAERLDRLKWVQRVFPRNSMFLMPSETMFVFNEARMAFINGELISTLLLVSAFAEHWLGSFVEERGFHKAAKGGLRAIVECARTNALLPEFLLVKVDHIQNIRNPFVHLKPYAHPHNLSQRAFGLRVAPIEVMERDAREALSIMYAIATVRC